MSAKEHIGPGFRLLLTREAESFPSKTNALSFIGSGGNQGAPSTAARLDRLEAAALQGLHHLLLRRSGKEPG